MGIFYVVSGGYDRSETHSTMEVMEVFPKPPEEWQWQQVKNLPRNIGRYDHSMVSLGTKIILLGGYGRDAIGNEVYELDCHTCDWRMLNKTLGDERRYLMVAF